MGPNLVRGFAPAGIGPRDNISGDALGGNRYYVGTVALGLPLGLPKELGITGRVFTDFGSLWSNDQKEIPLTSAQLEALGGVPPVVLDSTALRASAGVGVTWKSPVGPIRLDLAVPIRKESFDRTQLFHISFGTRF
jgi:outer membrane protein insertion porin family